VPPFLSSLRTTLRTAATAAGVLLAATGGRAQPGADERRDDRQADVELRRRLEPLVPSVRAALEGNNRDAQKAALAVAADFPPALSINARLPGVVAAFLLRDGTDPELAAMGLRAYGRMVPDAPELARVAGRYAKAESADVRRAAAEALATAIQNAAPALNSLADARYFVDVAAAAVPLLNDALGDRDERVQRAALDGVQAAARVVAELYANNAGPLGDATRPKEGTSRFEPLRPVLRALGASIAQLAKPLAAREPATRLAAARTLESIALTRHTVLNTQPRGEPVPADPFPDAWPSVRPALAERVKDPDAQVRLAAVQAMESLGDGLDTRDLLRQATTDRVVFVRWAAARSLGRSAPARPDPAAVADDVAALGRLSSDPDPDVRTAALTALARFGPAAGSAAPVVLTAAGRGDVEPRVAAVNALGALQTDADRTIPVLIAALKHPDLRLRRVAAAGLVRFGPGAKAALPELRQAVLSDDQDLRLAAAEAILAIERVPRIKEL
jgi:HEAT repeat protein